MICRCDDDVTRLLGRCGAKIERFSSSYFKCASIDCCLLSSVLFLAVTSDFDDVVSESRESFERMLSIEKLLLLFLGEELLSCGFNGLLILR